jgi:transcriptional regulator with XRE-family HTH domain
MIKIREYEEELKREITFCDNFRYLMRTKKVTYSELAKALGVSAALISNYRLGRVFPSEDRIKIIAKVLGCSIDDLFDEDLIPWEEPEE